MDELHYVYALTCADCPAAECGPGVDPRHGVELLPCGRIAAAASLVGLDRFDLTKIQEGSADVAWLSRVALRHNAIVQGLAQGGPVLPLRLGTLFRGKPSLMERLARCETEVAAYLDALGDRQEWAVKVYLDRGHAERQGGMATSSWPCPSHAHEDVGMAPAHVLPSPRVATRELSHDETAGAGVRYLAGRREKLDRAAQVRAVVGREVSRVESHLQTLCSEWRRLRPLSPELTARPESMVWNGAFLASKSQQHPLRAACDELKSDLASKGLLLELTGPWPIYHFCEGLGIRDEVRGTRDEG